MYKREKKTQFKIKVLFYLSQKMRRTMRLSLLCVPKTVDVDRYLLARMNIDVEHQRAQEALNKKRDLHLLSLHDSLQRPVGSEFSEMFDG